MNIPRRITEYDENDPPVVPLTCSTIDNLEIMGISQPGQANIRKPTQLAIVLKTPKGKFAILLSTKKELEATFSGLMAVAKKIGWVQ